MTFGIGSPGFDPFWCNPEMFEGLEPGTLLNVICIDFLDFFILIGLMLVGTTLFFKSLRFFVEWKGENE